MRAVVFKGVKSVAVEDRPIPIIQDTKDIIVKVRFTAVCGRYVIAPVVDAEGYGDILLNNYR